MSLLKLRWVEIHERLIHTGGRCDVVCSGTFSSASESLHDDVTILFTVLHPLENLFLHVIGREDNDFAPFGSGTDHRWSTDIRQIDTRIQSASIPSHFSLEWVERDIEEVDFGPTELVQFSRHLFGCKKSSMDLRGQRDDTVVENCCLVCDHRDISDKDVESCEIQGSASAGDDLIAERNEASGDNLDAFLVID